MFVSREAVSTESCPMDITNSQCPICGIAFEQDLCPTCKMPRPSDHDEKSSQQQDLFPCPKCTSTNKVGSKFCNECGTRLIDASSQSPNTATIQEGHTSQSECTGKRQSSQKCLLCETSPLFLEEVDGKWQCTQCQKEQPEPGTISSFAVTVTPEISKAATTAALSNVSVAGTVVTKPASSTYSDIAKKFTQQGQHSPKDTKKKETRRFLNMGGLQATLSKSVEVVFHVLIHKTLWEWDANSAMYMQFGHPNLGGWKDCGVFLEKRDFGNGLFEMVFEFKNFDNNILKSPVPYKYVVSTMKLKKDDRYEYLHAHSSHWTYDYDRCLIVPEKLLKETWKSYHKYDTFAYPRSTKTLTDKAYELLSVVGIGQSRKGREADQENVPETFTPPNFIDMSVICLDHYLLNVKEMLYTGSIPDEYTVETIAKKIHFIFNSLCNEQYVAVPGDIGHRFIWENKKVKFNVFKEKLSVWFESVVRCLAENQDIQPFKKLVSATAIIFSMQQSKTLFMPRDPKTVLLPLAEMLSLHPEIEDEYQRLCTYIPKNLRADIADVISELCQRISGRTVKTFAIEWLTLLPLYHNLIGKAGTNKEQKVDFDIAWIDYNKLGFQDISRKAEKENLFVVTHYKHLKKYFTIDPMILNLFACLAPKKEFCQLCDCVPTYIAIETFISKRACLAVEEELWSKDLERLRDACMCVSSEYSSLAYLSASIESSLKLCMKVATNRLKSNEDHIVVLLRDTFSCALCAIEKGYYENTEIEPVRKQTLRRLKKILQIWISSEQVIGGNAFGCNVLVHYCWKGNQELKIWQCLLSMKIPKFGNCEALKEWCEIVGNVIQERISEISSKIELMINLVIEMENIPKIHPILEEIIMEAALEAVDENTEKSRTQDINIDALAERASERVGKLLGKIFDKYYSVDLSLTIGALVTWNHWPRFINICECQPDLSRGFSQKCIETCTTANKLIVSLCKRLKTREVSLNEVEIVDKKIDQIKCLYKACLGFDSTAQLLAQLERDIKRRMYERKTFLQHQLWLSHFCHYIDESLMNDIKGLADLLKEVDRDYKEVNLINLCSRDEDDQVCVDCFQSARRLFNFLIDFEILTNKHRSDLFINAWRKALSDATRNPKLGIDDIYVAVWQPCLKECKEVLTSLLCLNMTLTDVDCYFGFHHEDLDTQLLALYNGITKCCKDIKETVDWGTIKRAIERIRQYWELCQHRDGANLFLEIRDQLGLHNGDFSPVEKLSKELSTSGESQRLCHVDDRLVQAGEFLYDITKDEGKMDCLRKFAKCQDIVKWLKEKDVTKDANDILNFVNVALATAEGDLSHDKLSHLRTVGSGFAPLIYNFPDNAGFLELKEACTTVWEALQKDKNLPNLLVECNKDIDWYRSVKETQGTVEVTSYGQMRNILKYGCYNIGATIHSKPMHDINDLISVKLIADDKQLGKTSYSVDDLRDLESKLVLITGSKAENRTEVDQYLDILHYVVRIAEVLLSLQQAGNISYSGRLVQFYCAALMKKHDLAQELDFREKSDIHKLGACAKEMEEALREWENEVKESRNRHYELNYYTTLQLLRLRKELGHIRQNPNCLLDPEILILLQSISPEIQPESVYHVISDLKSFTLKHSAIHDVKMIHEQEADFEVSLSGEYGGVDDNDDNGNDDESENTNVNSQISEVNTMTLSYPDSSIRLQQTIKPQLTREDLNESQRSIFADLVQYQGYSELLVLKALEEHPESVNTYDILDWCDENQDLMKFEKQEEQEHSAECIGSIEELSSSDNDDKNLSVFDQGPPSGKIQHKTSLEPVSDVKVVHRLLINESNPLVQQLVKDFGYNLERSIKAIQLCGGDLDNAMDYLDSSENNSSVIPELSIIESTDSTRDDIIVFCNSEAEEKYLSLEELGVLLGKLTHLLPAPLTQRRTFLKDLKTGAPNLLVTSSGDILKTFLYLYMEDKTLPLPTLDEVIICTSTTTAEEIILLWQRAVDDPGFKRIFCLLYAEKLSYQISDKVMEAFNDLSQGRQDYRLVILCSKEGERKSHIISKLLPHKKSIILKYSDEEYKKYLKDHFVETRTTNMTCLQCDSASFVDPELSCVRIVSSTRNGMGKSLFIERMRHKLSDLLQVEDCSVVIPIHGPIITANVVLDYLKEHYKDSKIMIYHFDIAPSVLLEVDTILLSLLILRGLIDSQGRVWRCHSKQLYAIEVTYQQRDAEDMIAKSQSLNLLSLLPTVRCLSPKRARNTAHIDNLLVGMDNEVFKSEQIQRVYQYLKRMRGMSESPLLLTTVSSTDCLELLLKNCGIKDPSWSEINHFTKFLNLQLKSCEKSDYCNENIPIVREVLSGFKDFVVKFMIRMSRDFATPSLQGEIARDDKEAPPVHVGENLDHYTIECRKRWEKSSHPYLFFNEDRSTITFVGFIITPSGNLVDPGRNQLESHIMTNSLYSGLISQGVNFGDDYRHWKKPYMIDKLCLVMGVKDKKDPDPTYVLTVDNLIKMLAIQMRFRCGIPVVIMGETGCGKTRLIRYMCDLALSGRGGKNIFIMKVHGGIRDDDIVNFIMKAENEAQINRGYNLDTIVFFDEANTSDSIGLFKEIMCDRRMYGKPISKDLKFIAACNPYRRHSDEMIKRLETAGLGFYVRTNETQQRLGQIPLRQLVYRVLDLPPSMRPMVYDFGQLKQGTEDDYIRQIVNDHVKKYLFKLPIGKKAISVIVDVLSTSQAHMRKKSDECSFVSLRDVERTMIVFKYFCDKIGDFQQADHERRPHGIYLAQQCNTADDKHQNKITTALVLAISVCYHARLHKRRDYEEIVSERFVSPLDLPGGAAQFRNEINWYQNVLLDNMELGPNIAKNAALRENIFMMAICIELRIPLFLVGKPGSSKSLAKSIIQDSMHGKTSRSNLLKKFKQVHIFSYQCSQLATSESILEVFKSAKNFQAKQDTTQFVSVVVLDEVGLAEDSPNLPLKVLHPLLEDGTEGAGESDVDEVIDREKRVAFIGISNWALDPAKMNRGVMVTRDTPDIRELEFSAEGICGKEDSDKIEKQLQIYFKPMARAYEQICMNQGREFFGLRDFYSLIKMLYWMCKETEGKRLQWPQIKHAIMRNFGGLESTRVNPLDEFKRQLKLSEDITQADAESSPNPDCSRLGLIKASLNTKDTSFHGENRYLLFLTENYAALDILKHFIKAKKIELTTTTEEDNPSNTCVMEPFTLFGSSFPKDKGYTQVCRNINQIKICMETGRAVILLNLEHLYESLYDVLNQYYMHYGDWRYVDLGLQSHRVKCRVHHNFKLILIAEKETVYEKFPTPLINRLEKHFILTSSVLKDWQEDVLGELSEWIKTFSGIRGKKDFKEGHAFIGYQKDTPAAVIFQASKRIKDLRKRGCWRLPSLKKSGFLKDISAKVFASEKKGSDLWKYAVLRLSQYLLLQTTSDDALVRLRMTGLAGQQQELMQLYFLEQHHASISNFVSHYIENDGSKEGLLMQVTTHGHILSREELRQVFSSPDTPIEVESFLLQEFDTELDFSNKISPLFVHEEGDDHNCLIVLQCDSGHLNGNLIACARYRIYDERVKASEKNNIQGRCESVFAGFQGDPWICSHVDDLVPTFGTIIKPLGATVTMSQLFIGEYINNVDSFLLMETACSAEQFQNSITEIPTSGCNRIQQREDTTTHSSMLKKPENRCPTAQCRYINGCIQAAISKLEDNTTKDRSLQQVLCLRKLIPSDPPPYLDPHSFYGNLIVRMYKLLKEREEDRPDVSEWILNEALNASKLEVGGTFRNVLARKIDEVIIVLLAKIIACIDRNCNLDQIECDPMKCKGSPLSQFWLAMFRDNVLHLKYSEMVQGDKVTGIGSGKLQHRFKCKMPFFWIIKEVVDSQCDLIKGYIEARQNCHKQLCEYIHSTPVGTVLKSVSTKNSEEFYKFYLHDFVKSVHKSNHRNLEHDEMEYQLISDALDHLVYNISHTTLTAKIAALHLAFRTSKSQILLFGQLVSHSPSILETLLGMKQAANFPTIELHLHAAEIMIEKLEPPLAKDDPYQNLVQWLNYVRLSQNTIDSILKLKSESEVFIRARNKWHRLRAAQLLVERVILKHLGVDLKMLARRLCGRWKQNADFLKENTLKVVQKQINNLDNLCNDKSKIKDIRKSCYDFYMELVSALTFGGEVTPEPAVINTLLDMVFGTTQTPYKDEKSDKIPTISSFLLQLLLDYSDDQLQVKEYLKQYLDKSCRVLVGCQATINQNLYLLVIQCIEDTLCKKFSCHPLSEKSKGATAFLQQDYYSLKEDHSQGTPSFEYLESVARVRYSLSVLAEVLKSEEKGQHFVELLKAAKQLCSDSKINVVDMTGHKDTSGPVIYLVKVIVRKYGMPCLKKYAEEYSWIIPPELKSGNETLVDSFAIYGDPYKNIRVSVSGAIHSNEMEGLVEDTKDLQPSEIVYLQLALYEKVTLSRAIGQPAEKISIDTIKKLDEFVVTYQLLTNEQRHTCRVLLDNQQGGQALKQISVSPQQPLHYRTILDVIVHTATVFYSRRRLDILLPFINMLRNPAALNQSYLPTMQEDSLSEVHGVMKAGDPYGKFYVCPRGHKYFVGECGKVSGQGICNVCHTPIGAAAYNIPKAGNETANLNDTTKKGHDLGDPKCRTYTTPERYLSARSVCILRALMHSAFIWAICNNDQALDAIAALVSPQPDDLPNFFWAHLEADIEMLGKDTGKGLDETIMIIHLVLRQILISKPPEEGSVQTVNTLVTREARKEWERIFNKHYIQPVLTNLDLNLSIAFDCIASDEKQGYDQLFHLAYEKVEVSEEKLGPHLWTYRSKITLEHLRQTMHEKKMKEKYPILYLFLQSEAEVRATQYLPNIARLQQCFYDKFNRQVDRKELNEQTIGDFVKNLPNESVKNEYREMIDSVKSAWKLVGHKLKNHGRLPVEDKYYIETISDTTSLGYLVPTTSEAGVCTTALVDFLTITHNNFIERCRVLMAEKDQSSLSFWREHKIPIAYLHHCHMVTYEHQLPSIILSHCHYSLKLGKGQDIKYEHQALENHILNRFIHGKPIIVLDIPQVVFRKDIYSIGTFLDVRRKVDPQERLPPRVRQDIINELRTPDRLRETLDVIEIVLGFLSSGGGKADKSLGEYIDKSLKMKKKQFSQKAKLSCQLKHILSLWETIAVELATQLYNLQGQQPFELDPKFLCELSKVESETLNSCLGQYDLDLLLGILYEFIETYIKYCPEQECSEKLMDTLAIVLDPHRRELPQIDLPASIRLDQTVATWKHIVRYRLKNK